MIRVRPRADRWRRKAARDLAFRGPPHVRQRGMRSRKWPAIPLQFKAKPLRLAAFAPDFAPNLAQAFEAASNRARESAAWNEQLGVMGWAAEVPPTTRCKHGTADCELCGTTSRRDAAHRTVGGKGMIARIK